MLGLDEVIQREWSTLQIVSVVRAYLHSVECLAIPLSSPLPGLLAVSKLHEDHVPIAPLRPNHPEVANFISRLLPHEPQEIRGRQVRRHSEYAKCGAILVLEVQVLFDRCFANGFAMFRLLGRRSGLLVEPRRFLCISVEPHHAPSMGFFLQVARLEGSFRTKSTRTSTNAVCEVLVGVSFSSRLL